MPIIRNARAATELLTRTALLALRRSQPSRHTPAAPGPFSLTDARPVLYRGAVQACVPAADRRRRPLSAGETAGPPPGYMEMLEVLRDPAHARHAEVIEWPGRDFDPNDANRAKLETDVAGLAKLMAPRRRASAKPKPTQKHRKPSDDELF